MTPLSDSRFSRLRWRLLNYFHKRLRRRNLRFKAKPTLPTARFGSDYGGWVLCPGELCPKDIVYSFGVGEDLSFDLALIDACGVCVHGFDPTPRAVQWLKQQSLPEEYSFHIYGLADFDGEAVFMPPEEATHASYSMITPAKARENNTSGDIITAPVRRLITIMKVLGHTRIDLLKMDIEGAEYAVIADLIRSDLRPRQILVEFHHQGGANLYQTWLAVQSLRRSGWRLFHVSETGYEFSFIDQRAGRRAHP